MRRPSPAEPAQRALYRQRVVRHDGGAVSEEADAVVAEEPLEILIKQGTRAPRRLGLLLRTPGSDRELVHGLLFGEGIIESARDVAAFSFTPLRGEAQEFNSVVVTLRPGLSVDWDSVARPMTMTSACGVCGRALLGHLHERASPVRASTPRVRASVLTRLPDRLRERQAVFAATGALHAAGLFNANGTLLALAEDVGRHNAVDKLVGSRLLKGKVPASAGVLVVSGRLGYEIVQKAARAGIGFVASVGAPSSLAIEVGQAFGITLAGFVRGERFNVYCGPQRVLPERSSRTSRGRS